MSRTSINETLASGCAKSSCFVGAYKDVRFASSPARLYAKWTGSSLSDTLVPHYFPHIFTQYWCLKIQMSFSCTSSRIRITVDFVHHLGAQDRIHIFFSHFCSSVYQTNPGLTFVSQKSPLPSVSFFSVGDCLGITQDLMNTEDGLINPGAFTRRCWNHHVINHWFIAS